LNAMKAWLILFFLAITSVAQAQDSTLVRVELKQGHSVQGKLSYQNDKAITINIPETGLMTIPWENIQTVTHLSNAENSSSQTHNPHATSSARLPSHYKKGINIIKTLTFLSTLSNSV